MNISLAFNSLTVDVGLFVAVELLVLVLLLLVDVFVRLVTLFPVVVLADAPHPTAVSNNVPANNTLANFLFIFILLIFNFLIFI